MKRSRFTEHQVLGILKKVEKGIPVTEVCRQDSISESTYYKWKSRIWRNGGIGYQASERA